MISASELVTRVASVTGLPYSTVYSVKRRFVESGIWPSSRGAHVPGLGSYHLVMLLLALLANVPAKDATAAASAYYSLADPDGNKLGDFLVDVLDSFKNREPLGLAMVWLKPAGIGLRPTPRLPFDRLQGRSPNRKVVRPAVCAMARHSKSDDPSQ